MRTLLLILGLLSSTFAFSQGTHVKLLARTADGGHVSVHVYRYTNSWGLKEVRLESGLVHATLGWGRDTDDDGKVETWFMLNDTEGMTVHTFATNDPWGTDALQNQLFTRYASTLKMKVSAVYGDVVGVLMMSVASAQASQDELYRSLVDMEEYMIRMQRARAQGHLTRDQWNASVKILKTGLQQSIDKFNQAMGARYWELAAADAALWASGGILVKGLARAFTPVAQILSRTALVSGAMEAMQKMGAAFVERYRTQMARLQHLAAAPIELVAANVFKRGFPLTMRALMAKNLLLRMTLPTLLRVPGGIKQSFYGWKYIAFMTALQLGTEAMAHEREVYSPNPTDFAENVLTHPEIMQNVGYMSSDAFYMTVATNTLRRPRARYAACAFIALTNSTVTNVVIKGDRDYHRLALDTGWEAIIGNAQIQIDLGALAYFERQAVERGNPRLKLLGWAVVLVDQVAGFAGYSAATTWIEGKQKQVQLVPVVAQK